MGSCGIRLRLPWLLAVHILILAYPSIVLPQGGSSGSIEGTVKDKTGGVIPDAKVVLKDLQKNQAFASQKTDKKGDFNFPVVPPGIERYQVTVEVTGFQTATSAKLTVAPPHETEVDITMGLGQVAETVVVSGAPILVDTHSASVVMTLDEKEIRELPLAQRNLFSLASTAAGVQINPSNTAAAPLGGGSFSLNGSSVRGTTFSIDGVDNNDAFGNGPALSSPGSVISPSSSLSAENIQQYIVLGQPGADFGRGSGAFVNVVTLSGTNQIHGTLFHFLGNDALNARNFFNPSSAEKSRSRRNQFGGTIGGPIVKSHLFFFTSYEGERETTDSAFLASLVTPTRLAQAIANIAGPQMVNPLSLAVLNFFPRGDSTLTPIKVPNSTRTDNLSAKVDISYRNSRIAGHYIITDGTGRTSLPSRLPGYRTLSGFTTQFVSVNYSQTIGTVAHNELHSTYHRTSDRYLPEDTGFDPASVGLITGATGTDRGLPLIRVAGFDAIGAGNALPSARTPANTFQLSEGFSFARGRREFKLGGDFGRVWIHSSHDAGFRGFFYFNSLEDFLLGRMAITRMAKGDSSRQTTVNHGSTYAQSSVKLLSSRLTLNLGLRWEYFGVISERTESLGAFVPDLGGLILVGQAGLPRLYNRDLNNFAPRVSLAWDPKGTGKLVVRIGYGLFFDAAPPEFFLRQSAPNTTTGGAAYIPLGQTPVTSASRLNLNWTQNVPIFGSTTNLPAPFDLSVADTKIRSPYSHQYTISFQYSPGSNLLAEAAYIGSSSHRVFRIRDINQPSPGDPSTSQSRRPFAQLFPQFAVINQLETSANSTYNGIQFSLHLRSWNKLTALASYALSHTIDNASDGIETALAAAFPQDSQNTKAERSSSAFDVRHRFTAAVLYDLPSVISKSRVVERVLSGWQVNALLTVQSGRPFTVGTLNNPSGTNEFADRPDLIGNPIPGHRSALDFLSFAAFSDRFRSRFGNVGRNTFVGANYRNVDFSLFKNNKFGESKNVQFRAEIFNLFNHPNFALPEQLISDGADLFGKVRFTPDVASGSPNAGGGPRSIQLALKFIF